MKQISANVYVETNFAGCNVGFVTTREGIVAIDTPMCPTEAVKWREEIISRGKVQYLVNTDQHIDHNSGNYFFPGTVIAHRAGRETLLMRTADEVIERVKRTDPQGLSLMEGY